MSDLVMQNVSVRFGSRRRGLTAVDGVDLTVPSGQVVGLVGESGSGKSTLARAAVGLAPLAGGRILLDGRPVPRRGRRPPQMVFQDPYASLDPRMTAGASIAEAIPRGTQQGAGSVLNVVRGLQRQLRLSMLFISHNLAVVRYVADAVTVMYRGQIVECGPVDEVLANPRHSYTRRLLSAIPEPGSRLDAAAELSDEDPDQE